MNFKIILLSLFGVLCVSTSRSFAQTRDTGREVMRGEMNFTELANYYRLHPEPLVEQEPENDEDDETTPLAHNAITDSSMIRRRAESRFSSMAPIGGGSAFLPISPAPNDTFESTIDNNTSIPPDTHGAVDSNYCMTTINTTVRIQNRVGGTISSVSLNAFFSPVVTSGTVYDPRVHYDILSHRWIFVADYGPQSTTAAILIAISQTSNPTGSWYEFKITADGTSVNWLDFPEVGINSKWVTVTGNMFSVTSNAFSATKIFMFNKANLLAGTSATFTAINQGNFTICPTLNYDATEQSMFFIEGWNADFGALRLSKVTGAVGSETWSSVGFPVSSQLWQQESNQYTGTGGADFAPQTGTANKIQTNDDRIDQMIYSNGHLWFAHTIFLPYSTSVNATRSSIQWWETDTLGNPIQVGNVDDATGANFYAFPSLAVNTNDDVLIGFAAMSATTHPSAAYAVRYHSDPADSTRPLQIFRHGQNTYYKTYSGTKNRWGDYSGAVVDPSNLSDFWTIQEASSATADTWDTWWAQVVMCVAPASITGTATVCAGSTTTLADATTGGTWTSSAAARATIGSTTGVVTGVASGTVTITYSTGANCFITTTVTVNPIPLTISGTSSVCAGSTVTLTDGTTGGTWSSGTTTVATVGTGAGIVSGVTSGTSIISYTLPTGCRITSTVTVNSLPGSISTSAAFCQGSTITLTDGTTGGTWSSGTTATATVVSGTGVVSGVAPGTSVITYTLGTGCVKTTIVSVNLTPVAITGSVPVCAGSTVTLIETTTGGTWSSGTTSVATVGTGVGLVSGVGPGTSTITYALPSGCSASSVVTVNPLPATISGSVPFCQGSTVTLTDGTTGGTWSSGTTATATVVSGTGVVSGVAPGTSVITYTLGTGCVMTTIVTVNITPAVITGSVPVCAGSTVTLIETTTGGTWSSGTTSVATVGTGAGLVSGVGPGTSIITYALPSGCSASSVVTVNPLPATISGSVPFCQGSTITLTDGTTGGTWSSSTTATATVVSGTGVVSGVAPGTSVITYTLGTGCVKTTIVSVNLTPVAITGSVPVCAGSTVTLIETTTGGTWSSGTTSVATVGTGVGLVSGVGPGTSTITYALPSGCSASSVVTVNPLPATISGSVPFCQGSTVTLTDGTTGGTWSSGTTATATVVSGTGVVSGVAPGTSVITYTLGTGCVMTTIATVNLTPAVITGSVPVCASSTVALIETTTGGTWSSGTTTVATVGTGAGLVSGVGPGTSIITYALPSGCSASSVVTVNPLPATISGSVPFCQGSTVTLTDGTTGGTWSSGTTLVATVITGTGVVASAGPGTSIITYTLGTGCSTTVVVTVNPLPAAISGSAPFCTGSAITLTDGTTGGTWSSGTTSVATIVPGTGVVSGVGPGTSIITYILPTGCSVTGVVTINPLPATIIGSVPVCVGSTITLVDGTTGGTWSSGTTSVATVVAGSGVVSGVGPGTSVITYTLPTGCSITGMVTVNPLPAGIAGSAPFCAGATITLTDGTTGGTWSSGTTSVATVVPGTGIVSGVGPGTSIITYTLPTGCSITGIVTVNPLPAAITGSAPFCSGSTITLVDGTTGGTWSSGTTSVATVVAGTGVVHGVGPGTSIITYTLPSTCSITAVVTVNPLPAVVAGSVPFCAGATITLTDGTTGGTWSSGTTSVATVVPGTGIVSGVGPGTSIITYTLPTGCSITGIVTVNPLPAAITGSAPFCSGSTITLIDGTTGGTWSSGTTSVATVVAGTGVVHGVGPGTSIITYTLPSTCSITAVVTVNPLPAAVAGSVPFCAGATITLTDGTTGGTWSSGTTSVATVIPGTGIVSGVGPGTSIITYTLPTGCSITGIVTVNPLPAAITGSAPFCSGSTITLVDGTTGGTWSSGTTSVATIVTGTGIVFGVAPGTSTITYELPTGCTVTATVTVNSLPGSIGGSVPVCVGSTITLTDGVTGGTWSSGTTSVATVIPGTGIVSGAGPGTSIITYSLGTGCTTTAIVTVNPLPAAISGSTPFCAGSTITLIDGTTGGTWSSGTTSVATIVPGTGVVSGVGPGTSIITYTLPTGCSITGIVTVNPLPAAITGSVPVCVGSTITLVDGTTGGTWSSGTTSVATVVTGSGVVAGAGPGISIITYSLGTGCSTTVVVTVNPLPAAISGSAPFCAGATITLTDGTTGGTWSSGSTSVATVVAASGVVSGVGPGTSIVTYTLPTGCSIAGIVTVNPLPAAITGSAPFCSGSTTTLIDGTTGGTWSSGTTSVATVVTGSGVVAGAGPGISIITYSLGTGCSTTVVVTVNPLPAAISGSVPFCAGSTIILTDGTTGGTWSSGTTSVATVVPGTGVVSGVGPGTSIITYTLPTGCSITGIVTINPLPAAITGSVPVCVGTTITLTDGTTGGTWSSGTTSVATVVAGTGVVHGAGSGTSIITYTLPTGCSITGIVTVNPLPAGITGSAPFCAGATITLTDGTTGGTWSSGTTSVATIISGTGVVSGVGPGTSIITYTLGTGCFITGIVTVNPLPATISGVAPVCAGTTITLTDGTTGGTWSSGTTSVATVVTGTGVVSGVAPGTSTITYELPTGCTVIATVTVNSLPGSIGGSVLVCVGSTITLTDGVTGGTWSSGTTSIATVVTGTGVITGVGPGTSIITYSLGTGCTITAVVTVNPLPAGISGVVPVCVGNTITLTDGTTGGTWSSGTTSVATVVTGTGVVSGVTLGTSTITYTLPTGCTITATVTVNSLPGSIGGSVPVCVGSAITLTDGVTGGTWSSGTTSVATVVTGTGVITGVGPGTSIITYSLGTGCTITSVVTVNPLPAGISGAGPVCMGNTITLTDGTTGGTWSSGTTSVATVVTGTGVVSGVAPGTSTITYTLPTGCIITATVTVNSLPGSIGGSVPVCVGSTISLTDGVTGGTWSSGTTSVATVIPGTGVVSGAGPGTSIITYSLGTGCTTTAIVTVNPLPTAISGSTPFCAGSTITLIDGTTGGTWSSGTMSVATVAPGTGVVSGVGPGTSIITYTLPTGCSITGIVTINPLPAAITGSAPVCVSSTITLVDGTTGGTWFSGTTSVATVVAGSGVVSGAGPGTSVITYTLPTGCSITGIVTVNPLPAGIAGSAPFCAGSTITLIDGTTGGTWSSGTTSVATVVLGTGVVSGVGPGTSIITYTLPTGCSITGIVTVNPLPAAITGSAPFCSGSTIALVDGTTGGTWFSGTTSVATVVAGSGVVSGVGPGTSIITYTLPTTCSITGIVTVNPLPAGITGSAPFCAVATITLTDGTTGGTWSSGTTSIATIVPGTGVVSGIGPGTSIITYTLGTGCFITGIVTVNALPAAISGVVPVCAGTTVTLTDGTTGGTWSSGTTSVATVVAGTGVVLGAGPGTSIITYTLPTTCSITGIVTVNPLPTGIAGSAPFCAGATITLTDGTTGGTWSSGTTSVATIVPGTGVVSGVGPGTSIITYTLGTGCFITGIVTVNPLPAAISGVVPVCAGTTVTLTDGTTGGTWSSGTTSVATIVTGSGLLSGVAPGTSSITYTLPTGCSISGVITVNSLPGSIGGSVPVCAGSAITLTDGVTGGTWSSGTTSVATVVTGTGVITGAGPGTSIITYSLGTGCTITAVVTVNPLPTGISGAGPVCVGNTITLTDGTTGGTWSSGTTSVATVVTGTGVVSGVAPGTSTITYELPTGCTVTATVTVNSLPGSIGGSVPVCAGSTITLTDGVTGGTWSSGTTSVATIVTGTGVITGVGPGTSIITYSLGTGCTITGIVTVNPLPAGITGSAPFCAGSTITLIDGTTGGTWSSGATSVATIVPGTGVVSGVGPGTSIITYTLPTGCSITGIVTVNPLPAAITGSAPFCSGSTITLVDGTTGGTWSSGTTSVATVVAGTGVVHGVGPGTSIITYTLPTGCSITGIVTVNPLPAGITGSAPFCAGSTITLIDGTTGGTWSSGTTSVATVVPGTGVVSGVGPGTSIITYTLPTGCSITDIVTVNPLPAAITGSAPFCSGSTITLVDVTTGGTWSSGTTSVATVVAGSGIVHGAGPGTSVITYTLPTGCPITGIVTVNPLPAAITGSAPFCAGSTITLIDGTTGGTWSSGSTSVATIVAASGVVSGAGPGTSVITYTLPTGCLITAVVTVNPLPAAITGSAPFCSGSTITLIDGTTGGTWFSGTTSVATVVAGSGVVSGVGPGTSIITYTLPTTCSITAVVTVNPLPAAIAGSAPFCAGATITLADGTTGGTWSSSSTSVATVVPGTGIVTGVVAGTAVITYTTGTGCNTTTVVSVNPLPNPITGSTPYCAGATETLADLTTGGTWTSGTTSIATVVAGTGVTTGVTSGTAAITYTLGTGCFVTSRVTINPLPAAIAGATMVCAGSTGTLTDGTTGGTWSSSTTATATIASTGVVTGVTAGTTTITYTLTTGCTTTTAETVNPTPLAITGGNTVCLGSTRTLADATTGGTWSSSAPGIATVGSTGIIGGVAGGSATITYALGTGCVATSHITVNLLPSAIAGPSSVCTGTTVALTDATSGGTWTSSATAIATVNSTGTVTGVASGSANITYTLGTGCAVTTTVTDNVPPPAISGSSSVCVGSTTTLTDVTSGGTWTSSSTSVASVIASSGLITGALAGTTTITYTAPTGCSATKVITVNALPSAISGTAVICTGLATTLSDGGAGTWSSSDISIASVGSGSGLVTGGASAGTATITYTLTSGCFITKIVTVNTVPSAITGPTSVCVGGAITLADGAGTWTSSRTAIATVVAATGFVSGVAPGTTTITYSVASGCSVSTVITVSGLPSTITGTATVCAGSTTTLSDATTGGTWANSSAGTATIDAVSGIISGVASGTTTITYTAPTGCTTTRVATVNSLPAAITATATEVCTGQAILLSDAGTGTWSSSTTSVATVTLSTGSVGGIAPGTSTITFTLATGCRTTIVVTISPTPGAIFGLSGVCPGSTITLTDGTTGGVWSTAAATASIDPASGIVTGVAAGTATITYTLGSCFATRIITVNPTATFSGTSSVCVGSSVTLTSSITGGTWSGTSPAIATVNTATGVITGSSPGTVVVSYTLPTGCITTDNVTVNATPVAISGTPHACAGSTVVLSDIATGGTWASLSPTTASVDAATGIVTGNVPGTAVITYTLGSGCLASVPVTVSPGAVAVTGTTTVCQGLTTTLSDVGSGTWTSDNTSVATVTSLTGAVSGVAPGTATISFTLITGCSASAVVTVNPTPVAIAGPSAVCTGSSITLTDASTGGEWTTSSSLATIDGSGIVSGISAGAASITYTLGSCIATTSITINPVPSITGATGVCVGNTITLADAVTGGTWASGSSSVATIAGAGIATGITAGTTAITYTMPTGCATTTSLTVNALPEAITGIATVCAGSTGTLADITTPGTWASGTTAIVTIDAASGVYAGVAAGTVTVTYTNSAGCKSTTVVTVNPLPAAITASAASVCAGLSATLSDAGGGTWGSSNPSVATIDGSGIATSIGAGTTTVTYTLSTGCLTTIGLLVDPLPAPITGAATVCVAGITTLSNTGGGTWSSSDGTIATVDPSTGIVSGVAVGAVNITYTLPTGCFVYDSITVTNCPGSVVKQLIPNGGNISVLPNPNKGEFSVIGDLSTTTDEDMSIEITDLLGQVIYKAQVTAHNGKLNEHIKLKASVANGMYLLSLRSDTDNKVFHLVVEQ